MLVLRSKTHVPGDLGLILSYPSALTDTAIEKKSYIDKLP